MYNTISNICDTFTLESSEIKKLPQTPHRPNHHEASPLRSPSLVVEYIANTDHNPRQCPQGTALASVPSTLTVLHNLLNPSLLSRPHYARLPGAHLHHLPSRHRNSPGYLRRRPLLDGFRLWSNPGGMVVLYRVVYKNHGFWHLGDDGHRW